MWFIRLALLKIAALITIGVRRVRIAMTSAWPNQRSLQAGLGLTRRGGPLTTQTAHSSHSSPRRAGARPWLPSWSLTTNTAPRTSPTAATPNEQQMVVGEPM